jgi:energy-coupling factor transporter ATP-binding protein EcfA2
MQNQKILIYGPPASGKSSFVKRIKGTEVNEIPLVGVNPNQYPVVYVTNEKPDPDNFILYTMILQFTENGEVMFEKGFELDSPINNQLTE